MLEAAKVAFAEVMRYVGGGVCIISTILSTFLNWCFVVYDKYFF